MGSQLSSVLFLSIFFFCAVFVAAAMILVSYVLGERHAERTTGKPYESGMPLLEHLSFFSFDIKYYLFAMFFVILDAESIFIFAWAVAARELGVRGYTAILVFIVVLLIALLYLWKSGALNWMHGGHAANARLTPGTPR